MKVDILNSTQPTKFKCKRLYASKGQRVIEGSKIQAVRRKMYSEEKDKTLEIHT